MSILAAHALLGFVVRYMSYRLCTPVNIVSFFEQFVRLIRLGMLIPTCRALITEHVHTTDYADHR
jgi:hypothetical protein